MGRRKHIDRDGVLKAFTSTGEKRRGDAPVQLGLIFERMGIVPVPEGPGLVKTYPEQKRKRVVRE